MAEPSASQPAASRRRTSSIAIVVAVLGGLGVAWYLTGGAAGVARMAGSGSAQATAPSGSLAASTGAAPSASRTDARGADAVALQLASLQKGNEVTPATEKQRIAALGMTRVLSGTNRVMLEGRERSVLGTKQIVNAAGQPETLLLVRDEVSGQIAYSQSGLHFRLKDGADYEAFIRDHARTQRLFVNPLYGQVAVDAADIAAVYNGMATDPRVVTLRFLDREPVRVLK